MKKFLILFYSVILCVCDFGSATSAPADMPTNTAAANSAVEKLNDSVTFYMSFDLPTLMADMSVGDGNPTDAKATPNQKPGLYGTAILPEKAINYAAEGNLDLSRTGSLSLWIKPFDWKRDTTPYITFASVNDHGRFLALMRMGDPVNREKIYAYAKAGDKSIVLTVGDSLGWKDNRWHLLVANWWPDSIDFSIDGNPVKNQHLASWATASGKPGTLRITQASATQPWLIDEVIVLNRPMMQDEIANMWKARQEIQ